MDRLERCQAMARTMRRWIIERSLASDVGHVGSALSVVELVCCLWEGIMRSPGTTDPDRDRFILAKGHAALALYCALRWKELLDEATFATYCRDGSALGAHPESSVPGVDLSTGSLGHGLSVGCGLAFAARRKGSPSRVYVLLSDAECNEGQVWEAAMFAGHHGLSNLCVLLDANGSQALGPTREILDLRGQKRLWEAFGWEAREQDGHDMPALLSELGPAASGGVSRPFVLVGRTVLGKGVSFMENRVEWHYRNLTPELAARALRELDGEA